MPFAVEMFLDPTTAAIVRDAWRSLAAADLATAPLFAGARPHLTLAVCERLDVDAGERFLGDFAAASAAPRVRFGSVGVFATDPAVVFLAPVVTPELLDLHDRFHRRFRDLAGEPWRYYLPRQWVPHCTIAERLPHAAVPQAVELCLRLPLPIEARLLEVGLVEFPPLRRRSAFPFAVQ